jgi:hypothetical protein
MRFRPRSAAEARLNRPEVMDSEWRFWYSASYGGAHFAPALYSESPEA